MLIGFFLFSKCFNSFQGMAKTTKLYTVCPVFSILIWKEISNDIKNMLGLS
jgi:hypothetical protein